MKLAYGVPRNTFTYLVDGWFSKGMTNLRNQVLSRYPRFYRNLAASVSKEVRVLLKIVQDDPRSVTYKNLKLIRHLTGLQSAELYAPFRVRLDLQTKKVPDSEVWRLGLLSSLFKVRFEKFAAASDPMSICAMIDSLCNT